MKTPSISPAIISRSTSKPRYVRGNLNVELAIHESSCFGFSTNRERLIPLSFRWCATCVAANRSKPSSLSSSSPAIDALRRLEPRPAISARPETVFLVSESKPNRRFPDCGGLSPDSLESLLRLLPAKKHSLHHSQRPKL